MTKIKNGKNVKIKMLATVHEYITLVIYFLAMPLVS